MGEAGKDALRVGFDRSIKLEFHGAKLSSDAGLFPYRDLDDAAQLTESGAADLFDHGAALATTATPLYLSSPAPHRAGGFPTKTVRVSQRGPSSLPVSPVA